MEGMTEGEGIHIGQSSVMDACQQAAFSFSVQPKAPGSRIQVGFTFSVHYHTCRKHNLLQMGPAAHLLVFHSKVTMGDLRKKKSGKGQHNKIKIEK
jgi:hypothetical protein